MWKPFNGNGTSFQRISKFQEMGCVNEVSQLEIFNTPANFNLCNLPLAVCTEFVLNFMKINL
jgi:hypothetical protein